MTPDTLKSSRKALGLSQRGLAEALGYKGKWANRDIRRMEMGELAIPERVLQGIRALLRGAKSVRVKTVLVFDGQELELTPEGE